MQDVSEKAAVRRLNVYQDKITCKPKCSSCCNKLVYITIAEAIIIQEYLQKAGVWDKVRAQAEELAGRSMALPILTWFKMRLSCPVLDRTTSTCMAYEVRPSICSTHFVTSPKELCDPWNMSGGQFQPEDFDDLQELFVKRLKRELDGNGVLAFQLPMPMALVIAERVKKQKGVSPEDVVRMVFSEYT